MGRPPIGKVAMSGAERTRRYRAGLMPPKRRRRLRHNDLPPGAELTNAVSGIIGSAVQEFQPWFRKWLTSNPSEEAKQNMKQNLETSSESLRIWAASIHTND
jgi:hypothetical protein